MSKDEKNKKANKHFFKDFKAELKKVIWPTPKQLVNNTIAVITIVLITAVIVFILDFAFEKMNTEGINKLKEIVDSKNEISNEVVDENFEEQQVIDVNSEEQVTEEGQQEQTSEDINE